MNTRFFMPVFCVFLVCFSWPGLANKSGLQQMKSSKLSEFFNLYKGDPIAEHDSLRQAKIDAVMRYYDTVDSILSSASVSSSTPLSSFLAPWFRHDHLVYILDSFDLNELNEFSSLLDKISQFALQGQTDIRSILATIPGHSKLIAQVSKINNSVVQLKAQHKAVIRYSYTHRSADLIDCSS